MTHTRRLALGLLAGLAASVSATAVMAQDWKAKYPELVYASVPAENASGVIQRLTPFMDYLSRELGVKVTLRIAADYAAVIEGQKAGNIHIGDYGPSSYVRAHTSPAAVSRRLPRSAMSTVRSAIIRSPMPRPAPPAPSLRISRARTSASSTPTRPPATMFRSIPWPGWASSRTSSSPR